VRGVPLVDKARNNAMLAINVSRAAFAMLIAWQKPTRLRNQDPGVLPAAVEIFAEIEACLQDSPHERLRAFRRYHRRCG